MSNDKKYNPYESYRRIGEMWEKGLNGLLFQSLDNNELIRMTRFGIETHSRYMEILKRNQELMAGYMNLPTKSDVANVAKLTIQAEEKVDILEDQIWNLQESFALANQEHLKLFGEMMEFTKKIQSEWLKTAQELAETKKLSGDVQELRQELAEAKKIKTDLKELKQELVQLTEIKQEFAAMKELLKKEKEEPVLATAGPAK